MAIFRTFFTFSSQTQKFNLFQVKWNFLSLDVENTPKAYISIFHHKHNKIGQNTVNSDILNHFRQFF